MPKRRPEALAALAMYSDDEEGRDSAGEVSSPESEDGSSILEQLQQQQRQQQQQQELEVEQKHQQQQSMMMTEPQPITPGAPGADGPGPTPPPAAPIADAHSARASSATPYRFTPTPAPTATPSWSARDVEVAASFHRSDQEASYADTSAIDALLPPATSEVDPEMKQQVERLLEQKHRGASVNRHLRHMRSFLNPVILEKLVDRFGIDEIGSNYPRALYNPHGFRPDEYYDRLMSRGQPPPAPASVPMTATVLPGGIPMTMGVIMPGMPVFKQP